MKEMYEIKKGDVFKYIGQGGFFTHGKTYTVKFDTIESEILENLPNSIAFTDDEGANHYCSENFLKENFIEVTIIKEDLQHEVICKGLAIRWQVRLNGEMSEQDHEDFINECRYFGIEIEDVLNEVEDMGNPVRK